MTGLETRTSERRPEPRGLRALAEEFAAIEDRIHLGGGSEAIARQHAKGRKTARERIESLLDADAPTLEIGLWAAHEMYEEWGGAPSAGVVVVIGVVRGR